MGKRTRGKEQKGKKTKIRMKSCIYIFCEGKTAEQMKREIKDILKKEKGISEYSETVDVYDMISDHPEEAVKRAERLERKQRQIYRVHSHECNPYTDMFKFVAYMDELKTENEKILKIIY